MSEALKIGVIYKSQSPQVLAESMPEGTPWHFEFFQETAIIGTPVAPRADFLAVFFPRDESPGLRDYLARIFPAAEIIGYLNPTTAAAREPIRTDGSTPVVILPMSLAFAHFMLDSFAVIHAGRKEQALIRDRADDLRTFFDAFVNMVESSGTVTDRKPAMSLLLNRIITRLRAEECLVYLCNEAGVTLERAYGTGNIRDIDLFEHQANSNIVDHVLQTGTAHLDNNLKFEIKVPFGTESSFIRSILCLPLIHRGQKIGVIEILNKAAGVFTEDDRSLMEMLVRPLAVAINTIRMFDNAERLTITDDLTKLYNYRYLMQYLESEVKRCLRYKKKVSLLFIDVDGFKHVNDTFGHLVGSLALAEMGQVLRKILRETDVVGRYGGDEFVVVLPETPLNGALVIAERIRKKVEDYEFVAQDLSIHLTVSLGIANCPKHTLTAEGLIKKADAAMYRAKELSKNSIKVAV
ncbi:MAG: sensor domain-containing diguanylate cyclase [Acidobacteriia bacterium]|nr:sensor domain-containing diguanylate cyclase [Terriglobia bacterium]